MKKKISTRSATAKKQAKRKDIKPFPIVGIGGSAGSLEAFSKLLEHLRPDVGMAYVYNQHLDPKHESVLPEILARKTKMPVVFVKNGMELKKNTVFVLPPNRFVSVRDGKLKLGIRPNSLLGFHSIDYFFSSLASLYQANAIGILLSGTATDGTLGLKAIKAEGGITFAQDETAQYQGMPRNASDAGFVDFVMPPERIAAELAALIKHPFAVSSPTDVLADKQYELRQIMTLLHMKRHVDFSYYKTTTVHRRIMRRMVLNHFKKLKDYYNFLKSNNTEIEALYQDLLIHVTSFFRDLAIFNSLTGTVWNHLLKSRAAKDTLRVWVAGCATGEEAYSIAISLFEHLGEKAVSTPIQIFSTDLNQDAIEKARAGVYSKGALQNVSRQRLRRFFVKLNGNYQVIKAVRDVCIFAPHNLLKDPPFSHMDLISCQNVMIYLENTPQQKILQSFHYALKPNGMLLLGKSESIGNASNLFRPLNKDNKIYVKKPVHTHYNMDFAMQHAPEIILEERPENIKPMKPLPKYEVDLEKETDKLLLTKYVPASVVVNSDYDVIRFRGSTSAFLQPPSGKASFNLIKMVRDDLVYDLRALLHKAKKDSRPLKKVTTITDDESIKEVSIEVMPVTLNSRQAYFLIIFRESSPFQGLETSSSKKKKSDIKVHRITLLEKQLKEEREHLKTITEEFEATREELQSANEEVLSSNEELQSINEELETSKEELQSTNEELTTINEELINRNEELKESRDYAEAIIATIREPFIVLTQDLRVQFANKAFYRQFNVTAEETEGNYLNEVGEIEWNISELRKNLRSVKSGGHKHLTGFELPYGSKENPRMLHVNAHSLQLKEGKQNLILLAIQEKK